ncbi:MAG: bifunctional phosphoribosyl-AMP cyclohydrolase/phosphoribosyl-ATP diphosphatase HisIE [Proteobacteria bacterium]|nr:bifunctional phosphoribosyl-AMP cyclohydrolase/phosphoribosyl-ATP diphosphatase HisIE [Pseudomonadota bacterium]
MINSADIDWKKCAGMLPAIVQDAKDQSVLMLGFMNEAALVQTQSLGKVTFFSRSKNRLWTKGESSGHFLFVKELALDCDGDTLLIQAEAAGPVCHTGCPTCFGPKRDNLSFLDTLQATVEQRFIERSAQSYTSQLFEAGPLRMAQKVGEEGLEVALAATTPDDEALLGEAADLIFHLTVLLRSRNLRLNDVVKVLESRHQ